MKSPKLKIETGAAKPSSPMDDPGAVSIVRRHLRFGWWTLLVFLTLGIVLEALHGFKVGAYLNPSQSTRRLMWTLAHAHGTLLALINLGFGFSTNFFTRWDSGRRRLASGCLMGASILLPSGFFLGGINIRGGDPGFPILLVPAGAILLLISVTMTALAGSNDRAPGPQPGRTGGSME